MEDDEKSTTVVAERLDPYVTTWNDEDLEKIVSYVKDWNTNARYCFTSQIIINSIIRVHKVDHFMTIKGASEAIPALLSYSERHFQRIDKLYQASYVLDYMSSLMSLLPNDTTIENVVKKITPVIKTLPTTATTTAITKPKIFQSIDKKRNNNDTDDLAEYNKRKNNDNKKRKVTKSGEIDNDPFFS